MYIKKVIFLVLTIAQHEENNRLCDHTGGTLNFFLWGTSTQKNMWSLVSTDKLLSVELTCVFSSVSKNCKRPVQLTMPSLFFATQDNRIRKLLNAPVNLLWNEWK